MEFKFKDYTIEQLKDIINLMLDHKIFSAIKAYGELSGKDFEPSIDDLLELKKQLLAAIVTDQDFSRKFVCEHNCYDCMGVCGCRADKLASFAAARKGCGAYKAIGKAPTKFTMHAATVNKTVKGVLCKVTRNIYVDGNIVSFTVLAKKADSKRIILDRRGTYICSDPGKEILTKLLRSPTSRVSFSDKEKPDLLKGRPKPKKAERYKDYIDRCSKVIRERSLAISKRVSEMSYKDAEEYIKGRLTESELNVVNSYPAFKEFMRDFYPNMSIWQVAEGFMANEATK